MFFFHFISFYFLEGVAMVAGCHAVTVNGQGMSVF
jgi:hypothetical protein